jgi:putative endonuclease
MHDVYIIQSERTGRYYIGQSEDAKMRLGRHNAGSVRSTKNGRPWKLVMIEKVSNRAEALKREKQIKSYKGGEAFKKLINK